MIHAYCVMMIPQDPVTWWTAFSAVAQAIGAIATFAAVAVSLWIVFSERAMKAQASAGIRVQFAGDGTPGIYMVGIEVINVGVRPFHVTSVGWRTGWLRRGPKFLTHRYAIQNMNVMLNQRATPHIVEPGRNEGFYVAIADMKRVAAEESRSEMFVRKIPLLGYCPIWAMVHITGRKPAMVRASKELSYFLRTNDHASTTDD